MKDEPIGERLARVRDRIAAAATQAGRDPASVRLIGASKRKPAELMRAAYEAGLRDFGENYVQELVTKAEALADLPDLRLHLIGHLQRNKARHVVRCTSMVQTVDSAELARELGRRALDRSTPLPVLVEVNVGGEESKSGCRPSALGEVLNAVGAERGLVVRGLMTLPPHTDDPTGARPYFEQLVALRDRHGGAERLPELSMGMTHDLEVAVAAGATIVRVGTAIFGERG